jgi:hypothetical protein
LGYFGAIGGECVQGRVETWVLQSDRRVEPVVGVELQS